MAILASSSYSITDVVDGKITYPHYAYSDNADGTGLTFTDTGQRYQGYYSDYTQADSTDKTKYRWADRWAKIEVGGRNLFLNSKFNFELTKQYSTYHMIADQAHTQGQLVPSIDRDTTFKGSKTLKIVSTFNGTRNNQKITFRTGGDDRTGAVDEMKNKSVMMSFWAKSTVANTIMSWRSATRNPTKELTIGTDWTYYSFQLIAPENSNATNEAILHIWTVATVWIAFPKVERGTVSTDYEEAPEDFNSLMESKADSRLTQEQLLALTDQTNRIKANMEALAAAKALTDLEEAYKEYVKANDAAKKVSEGELAILKERTAKHVKKLAEFAEDWEFMNKKLRIAEEGIYFGKLDGSSEIKITDDRISFWSSKKEVMWITAGTLNIDNGIFTVSVQIGRFREEQYTTNPDINVIRYVG